MEPCASQQQIDLVNVRTGPQQLLDELFANEARSTSNEDASATVELADRRHHNPHQQCEDTSTSTLPTPRLPLQHTYISVQIKRRAVLVYSAWPSLRG